MAQGIRRGQPIATRIVGVRPGVAVLVGECRARIVLSIGEQFRLTERVLLAGRALAVIVGVNRRVAQIIAEGRLPVGIAEAALRACRITLRNDAPVAIVGILEIGDALGVNQRRDTLVGRGVAPGAAVGISEACEVGAIIGIAPGTARRVADRRHLIARNAKRERAPRAVGDARRMTGTIAHHGDGVPVALTERDQIAFGVEGVGDLVGRGQGEARPSLGQRVEDAGIKRRVACATGSEGGTVPIRVAHIHATIGRARD